LANITGENSVHRDYVLQQGALGPLLTLLSESHQLGIRRRATWALSNLCRGNSPQPDWELVRVLSSCLDLVILTWPSPPPDFPRIANLGEVDRFHGRGDLDRCLLDGLLPLRRTQR
jgi:hypothetical protein